MIRAPLIWPTVPSNYTKNEEMTKRHKTETAPDNLHKRTTVKRNLSVGKDFFLGAKIQAIIVNCKFFANYFHFRSKKTLWNTCTIRHSHCDTTSTGFCISGQSLSYISVLHQTTTHGRRLLRKINCLISLFYIKPQRASPHHGVGPIVLYLCSTSNHNTHRLLK